MNASRLVLAGAVVALTLSSANIGMAADANTVGSKNVKHVLLLSIDGMHAVDFYNCSHGIAGANSGDPYCPNLAALARTGINYVATSSSKPSDSAPGLMALVTGGTPRTTGIYYDVAFDRTLDGPEITTGTGLAAAPCTPGAAPTGTTTDNDQGIDLDDTKLNGGGDSGAGSIDPKKLSRNPAAGCAPVYPWNFLRTQHHLRRNPCSRRIHGVDRQASVICDGRWSRRQGPERLLRTRGRFECRGPARRSRHR